MREEYVTVVLDRIDQSRARSQDISVFLTLDIDWGKVTAAEALDIVNLAIKNKPRGVAGVDLWEMCLKSVDAIFGGETEKTRLRSILQDFKVRVKNRFMDEI